MSQNESDDEPSSVKKALRTVTPGARMHRDMEMDAIGWAIFAGILVITLPLLPILVVVWLLTKLFGRAARRAND